MKALILVALFALTACDSGYDSAHRAIPTDFECKRGTVRHERQDDGRRITFTMTCEADR